MKIGDYIKKLREDRGLSLNMLAIKAGLSNATISYIENGRNKPSLQTLQKLAEALNADLAIMISMLKESTEHVYTAKDIVEVDMSFSVPLVGSVRAGRPILAEDNIEDYVVFNKRSINPAGTYFALRIVGDSMDKLFRQGDIVLVEKTDVISSGQIAVVGINGYEATVKRVTLGDGNIALIPESNNPAHVTKVYNIKDDEIHIIGRVVQSTRFF